MQKSDSAVIWLVYVMLKQEERRQTLTHLVGLNDSKCETFCFHKTAEKNPPLQIICKRTSEKLH